MADGPSLVIRVAANLEELRKNLAEGKSQIETTTSAMEKLAQSLSGDKLTQRANDMVAAVNAIGGATKLTGSEQERVNALLEKAIAKYDAMGREAPAGMRQLAEATKQSADVGETWNEWLSKANNLLGVFGITIGASAAFQLVKNFTQAIFDNADALSNMSTKTGLSVEQLQKFAEVGAASHVSIEDFAQAAFKLGVALEGGETSVVQAVEKLKLNYQKLLQMSPDQQFNTVAKSLENLANVQERNRIGVDLMGKSYAVVAPAIAKGFTEMADAASAATAQEIAAIDHLGDAWDQWVIRRKNQATSLAGATVLGTQTFSEMTLAQQLLVLSSGNLASIWDRLIDAGKRRASQVDIELPKEEHRVVLTKAQQEAATKLAAAMEELDSVGKGWQGTLDTIDGRVVEAIKYYLEAGVSQNSLATAFGLTAAQVKAVDAAMKDAISTQKVWTDFEKESHSLFLAHWKEEQTAQQKKTAEVNATVISGQQQIQRAQAELHDTTMKQTLDSTSYKINKIWEEVAEQERAFKGSEEQRATYNETVEALAAAQANAIAEEYTSAVDRVADHGLETVAKATAQLQSLVGGTKLPGSHEETSFGQKFLVSPTGNRVPIGPHGEMPDNWFDMYSGKSSVTGSNPLERRAGGGSVAAGQAYTVGERGPETLVMGNQSGTIIPNGGAAATTINVYVTQPLGTPMQIADAVGPALIAKLKSQGVRLSSGA